MGRSNGGTKYRWDEVTVVQSTGGTKYREDIVFDDKVLRVNKFMNLLTDKLPVKVLIDAKECELNTDFRNVLLYFRALKDKELSEQDKLSLTLTLFFKTAPKNAKLAIEYINNEYIPCGAENRKQIKTKNIRAKLRAFCFDRDSSLIFAAFYQQYGINLNTERMHWYVFKALFDGLSEATYFRQIVNFRQMDIKDIPKDKRKDFLEAQKELCSELSSKALSVEMTQGSMTQGSMTQEDNERVRTAKEIERDLLEGK